MLTVFPKGKHDDQADSTAHFLDWFKKPFPGQGLYEYYRQRAQELEEQRKPQPVKTVSAVGCMEWQAEQEKARSTAAPDPCLINRGMSSDQLSCAGVMVVHNRPRKKSGSRRVPFLKTAPIINWPV